MQYDGGKTVLVICHNCRATDLLRSEDGCRSFLLDLARHIAMTPLGPGQAVTLTHPKHSEKSGVSATQMIQESHLAIHTWPEVSGARVLVDSCKSFPICDALEFVADRLQAGVVEVREPVEITSINYEPEGAAA